MDNPIILTPQEIVNVVLAICGAIITIAGAGTVIIRVIAKAKEPNQKQNERIESLEGEIEKIKERLQAGNVRFASDSDRMERIEITNKESMKVVIESLQALTAHAIDGNNTENLRIAKKRLDEYLIDKL